MSFAPNFDSKTIEESIEERAKYRHFFNSEKELQLFLRLPISDSNRIEYIQKLAQNIEAQRSNENDSRDDKKQESERVSCSA